MDHIKSMKITIDSFSVALSLEFYHLWIYNQVLDIEIWPECLSLKVKCILSPQFSLHDRSPITLSMYVYSVCMPHLYIVATHN